MPIPPRMERLFDAAVRTRGHLYFEDGRVTLRYADDTEISAVVRGTHLYRVSLLRDRDRVGVSCSCPYFAAGAACKHLWAVLLTLDVSEAHRGFLGGVSHAFLVHAGADASDEDDEDDAFFDDEDDPIRDRPWQRAPRRARRTPVRPSQSEPSAVLLSDAGQILRVPERQAAILERIEGYTRIADAADLEEKLTRYLWRVAQSNVLAADRLLRQRARSDVDEVLYLLSPPPSTADAPDLRDAPPYLSAWSRRRRKDGTPGAPRPVRVSEWTAMPSGSDRRLLAVLASASGAASAGPGSGTGGRNAVVSVPLVGGLADAVLPSLCETGRLYVTPWGPEDSSAAAQRRRAAEAFGGNPVRLDADPPWQLWLAVRPREPQDVLFRLNQLWGEELDAGRASVSNGLWVEAALRRARETLPLRAALVIFQSGWLVLRDRVCRWEAEALYSWIPLFQNMPHLVVPGSDPRQALAELAALPALPRLMLDPALGVALEDSEPRPKLTLTQIRRSRELAGRVAFRYGETEVDSEAEFGAVLDEARTRITCRNRAAEQAHLAALRQAGVRRGPPWRRGAPPYRLPDDALPGALSQLLSQGWQVTAEGKVYRQPAALRMRVRSGIDWFDLEGEVDYDGQPVPLPGILEALRKGAEQVTLPDGSVGLLPETWRSQMSLLVGLATRKGKKLRFSRNQAALLDLLLEAQPEVDVDAEFEQARSALRDFTAPEPHREPAGFSGTLRGYQREGLGWLAFLRRLGLGGCLADDMGLGKTVQTLAALCERAAERDAHQPSLVVAPKSVIWNWAEEAARFAPQLRVVEHTGPGRARSAADLAAADLVLTTYGVLRRDAPLLADIAFDYVVLDEAQAIKNPRTATAKAARLLRGAHRLALSGTPVENHLGELWSLFAFLNPGMLGRATAFGRLTGQGDLDSETHAAIRRALRPYILRRTKAQVAPELPPRSEQVLYCDLTSSERTIYDGLRAHYRRALLGARTGNGRIRGSKVQVLEALLRLRQAACHPGLVDPEAHRDASSAKLQVLLEMLPELAETGHKALVFSQFTRLLGLLKPRLDAAGLAYEYLDGRTRNRAAKIERFQQNPSVPIFLISLKAGGLGLNLTAADYVFLLDPWWNPAAEAQAIDRTHRIGQERPVVAYRLIARDTVEDKVLALQAKKRALADAIITSDNRLLRDLTVEDLKLLLG